MRHPTSGQRSQTAGNDRELALVTHWSDFRVEILRELTSELCASLKYRGAEAITGVSKEGLRKFVEGKSRPNRSTRQKLGELFLKLYPGGVMWKKAVDGDWELRQHLSELLPPNEEAARAELAKIFELARRFPDEVPGSVDAVQEWVDLQVRGEYWGKRYVEGFSTRKQRRKPAPGSEPDDGGGASEG
jgi:hypothetical protein